ncbi:MAG: hypothetical protein KUG75_04770 [Pseudomonadales bacterium]|nr:hypothetical protein [Pseudomonadales bacterium]
MTTTDEERFLNRARKALESEDLGEDISQRLYSARRKALDQLDIPEKRAVYEKPWFTVFPVGAIAALVLVFNLFWLDPEFPEMPNYESELHAAAATELELLEDLEFVAWMLAEDLNAG